MLSQSFVTALAEANVRRILDWASIGEDQAAPVVVTPS
jgi:hypothetical protein